MRLRLLAITGLLTISLTGCGQIFTALMPAALVAAAAPSATNDPVATTPESALAKVEATKTQITNVGETVQETASVAADKLETFGNGVISTGQYVGGKVEGLGNLVIEATGGTPSK